MQNDLSEIGAVSTMVISFGTFRAGISMHFTMVHATMIKVNTFR